MNSISEENAMEKDELVSELDQMTTADIEEAIPLTLDAGYAWIIMIAGMFNSAIVDGVVSSFGILLVDLIDYFDSDKSSVSIIGALLCAMYPMSGPIAGALVNKFGCRPVCMLGAVIACVAFILGSFTKTLLGLSLTYGILGGFGCGLIHLPSMICVSFYFQQKRGLAIGLVVCGTGIGTSIMSPLTRHLIEMYGWQNTLLILAGILLNSAVCGALLKPNEPLITQQITENEDSKLLKKRNRLVSEISVDIEKLQQGLRAAKAKRLRKITQTADTVTEPPSPIHRLAQQYVEAARQDTEIKEELSEVKEELPTIMEAEVHDVDNNKEISVAKEDSATNEPGKKHEDSNSRILFSSQTSAVDKMQINKFTNSGFNINNIINGMSIANLEDIKRPLYQKDIFYTGSVMSLATSKIGKSSANLAPSMLFLSMTRIPPEKEEYKGSGRKLYKLLSKPIYDALAMMTNSAILKNQSYLIIWLANLVCMISYNIPLFFVPDFAKDNGIQESQAAWLNTAYGIANTIGRVGFGWFAGLPKMSPLLINNISLVITGILIALLPLCKSYASIMFTYSAIGIFMAPFISLASEILCALVGLEALTNAFGLLTLARGLTAGIGPPIAVALYTEKSGYTLPFILGGTMFVISGGMHAILHLPKFRNQTKENKKELESIFKSAVSLNNSIWLINGSQLIATSNVDLMNDNFASCTTLNHHQQSPEKTESKLLSGKEDSDALSEKVEDIVEGQVYFEETV